jgi:hypothetical protein
MNLLFFSDSRTNRDFVVDSMNILLFVIDRQRVHCDTGIQFLNICKIQLVLQRNNIVHKFRFESCKARICL